MPLPEHTLRAATQGREGFHYTESGDFAGADGFDAVHLMRLHVIRQSLALEINTGMKACRFSALKAANEALGTKYRRKIQAFDHINDLLISAGEGAWPREIKR